MATEVVYEPTVSKGWYEVEYFNKFQYWENAAGNWTFGGVETKIKEKYYADHTAYEMADYLAHYGHRSRVIYHEKEED